MLLLAPQAPAPKDLPKPSTVRSSPKGYVCPRRSGPVKVDGKLDEDAWLLVPWTDFFVDIQGDPLPRPRFRTRVKMMWDDQYFYIAAEMEEPHVWGTLTQHDSVIFQDNDFEVFIDPDGDNHEYYEIEINALNTEWDLFLDKPYRDGGPARNEWEIPGLLKGVHVQGTLNDPADADKGWTVELAIPWKELGKRANRKAPPEEGDQWRVNFSRVEWKHEIVDGRYRKVAGTKEDNWVWSPQGVIDMHRPERWGYVQFTKEEVGKRKFQPDLTGPGRDRLHRIYYAQKAFQQRTGKWAGTLKELGLNPAEKPSTFLQTTAQGYEALVVVPQGLTAVVPLSIGPDSKIKVGEPQSAPGIERR